MKQQIRFLSIVLLIESIVVIWIGYMAIRNVQSFHRELDRLNDMQTEYYSLQHALIDNVNQINNKDELIKELEINGIHIINDDVIVLLISNSSCGGCVISLINQLIDEGINNIIVLLEATNPQVENAFKHEKIVSIQIEPHLFDSETPPCRILINKQGHFRLISYHSIMYDSLHFIM